MRKLLFLFIFLLAVSVSADDFLDSLVEQRYLVMQNLGYDSTSNAVLASLVDKMIREGYTILAPAISGRHWTDSITTVQNQVDYTLDSQLIKIRRVYWHRADSLKTLRQLPAESLNNIYHMGWTLLGKSGFIGRPSIYIWQEGTIKLFPVPYIADDTIIIDGIARVDSILSDLAFTDEFPVMYRPVVVAYATWRVATIKSIPDKVQEYWKLLQYQSSILNLTINWGIKEK